MKTDLLKIISTLKNVLGQCLEFLSPSFSFNLVDHFFKKVAKAELFYFGQLVKLGNAPVSVRHQHFISGQEGERKRTWERERECVRLFGYVCVKVRDWECVCVCVCVWEREGERERDREGERTWVEKCNSWKMDGQPSIEMHSAENGVHEKKKLKSTRYEP